MSKRRAASILMFGKKRALQYPAHVVAIASGTGVTTGAHVVNVDATNDKVYLNVASKGTVVGTLVGTA